MKLGTLLSKGKVRPYDTIVVKKMRFDFKPIDIYDGHYRNWSAVMMYLEMNAAIIAVFTHKDNKQIHIILYE